MSHPRELIDRIALALEAEYSREHYQFVFEKTLPGTRMLPDIVIQDSAGKVQVAVEIGYTRPEKLTAYRRLGIPDVRWYDKEGRQHGEFKREVLRVEFAVEPRGRFRVYFAQGEVSCGIGDCNVEFDELVARRARLVRRYGDPKGDKARSRQERRYQRLHEALDLRIEEALEETYLEVLTWVITDGVKVFYPSYCDVCGTTWLASPEDDAELIHMRVQEHDLPWRRAWLGCFDVSDESNVAGPSFYQYMEATSSRALALSWAEAQAVVKAQLGLDLSYMEDGAFIDPDHGHSMRLEVRRLEAQGRPRSGPQSP